MSIFPNEEFLLEVRQNQTIVDENGDAKVVGVSLTLTRFTSCNNQIDLDESGEVNWLLDNLEVLDMNLLRAQNELCRRSRRGIAQDVICNTKTRDKLVNDEFFGRWFKEDANPDLKIRVQLDELVPDNQVILYYKSKSELGSDSIGIRNGNRVALQENINNYGVIINV